MKRTPILTSIATSITSSVSNLARRWPVLVAAAALVISMGGTWAIPGSAVAAPAPSTTSRSLPVPRPTSSVVPATGTDDETPPRRLDKTKLGGKINLNTATEEQLMMLPTVGPSKAERIVTWRKRNGAFKRIADLRRVKGFGYKTFKRLEPLLDIKGETTLAQKL